MVVAEGTTKSASANQYSAAFIEDYDRECIQTSQAEGLEREDAERLCHCTISEFQSQYSMEEFQQLTVASATDPEAESALVEVGQFCFEQILYEE
jgi:hypothetical protein